MEIVFVLSSLDGVLRASGVGLHMHSSSSLLALLFIRDWDSSSDEIVLQQPSGLSTA